MRRRQAAPQGEPATFLWIGSAVRCGPACAARILPDLAIPAFAGFVMLLAQGCSSPVAGSAEGREGAQAQGPEQDERGSSPDAAVLRGDGGPAAESASGSAETGGAQSPPAQSPPAQSPPAQSPPAQSPPAQSPPAAPSEHRGPASQEQLEDRQVGEARPGGPLDQPLVDPLPAVAPVVEDAPVPALPPVPESMPAASTPSPDAGVMPESVEQPLACDRPEDPGAFPLDPETMPEVHPSERIYCQKEKEGAFELNTEDGFRLEAPAHPIPVGQDLVAQLEFAPSSSQWELNWSASSGTFVAQWSSRAYFLCSEPGTVTITLNVVAPLCQEDEVYTAEVECAPAQPHVSHDGLASSLSVSSLGAVSVITPEGAVRRPGEMEPWRPTEGRFTHTADVSQVRYALADSGWIHERGFALSFFSTPPFQDFVQLSGAGPDYACGVRTNGDAVCWGSLPSPQRLDSGFRLEEHTDLNGRTELIEVLEGAMQVTAGEHTACALLKEGGIRCRGGGWPVLLDPPVGRFIQVAPGRMHGCVLRVDGSVYCWKDEPMAVPLGTFTHIASGDDASCGVATDGSLQCWGEDKLMAKLPPPAGTYTQVEMGRTMACALSTAGDVRCWGKTPKAYPFAED